MGIGDSLNGKTEGFDPSVLGSSPSPRAMVGACRHHYGIDPGRPTGESMVNSGNLRKGRLHHLNLPAPCRLCGGPSWLQDAEGSIHPCCELSARSGAKLDADGLLICPACRASEVLNREQRRRHG